MRKGITIEVTPADRVRLQSIIRDRNSRQKHVWRARIIVLTAAGEADEELLPWNWKPADPRTRRRLTWRPHRALTPHPAGGRHPIYKCHIDAAKYLLWFSRFETFAFFTKIEVIERSDPLSSN